MVDVAHFDQIEGAVCTPVHEHEIDNPYQAPIDKVQQDRQPLAGHLATRKLDYKVTDRAHHVGVVRHVPPPSLSLSLAEFERTPRTDGAHRVRWIRGIPRESMNRGRQDPDTVGQGGGPHMHPAIADHGLIGDLQSAALGATDGTIDWFCWPRFDSPSVFASLLDERRGGRFALAPSSEVQPVKKMYMPDTAILVTRYLSECGIAEVLDFMPVENPTVASERRCIVRVIKGVRGEVRFRASVEPRFDYGRKDHRVQVDGTAAVFECGDQRMHLIAFSGLESDGTDVRSDVTVRAGDVSGFLLETGSDRPRAIGNGRIIEQYQQTEAFWRRWIERSTYRGRWREHVERSAITLKLLTYAPSGGLVAAPTASLPEQVGGARNWDYRYTWVRDGSLSVFALLGLGMVEEAAAFGNWLRGRVEEATRGVSGPLRTMYRVDGSPDLTETTLDHFDGYRGSRPVRIGNGASDQLQLDIYGEALNSLQALDGGLLGTWGIGHDGWRHIVTLIEWLCDHWREPEEGIWETRGGRRPFVYGQLMSWVALDRAIRMATSRGRPADLARWT